MGAWLAGEATEKGRVAGGWGTGWNIAVETTLVVRAVLSSHWRETRKCLRSKKLAECCGII